MDYKSKEQELKNSPEVEFNETKYKRVVWFVEKYCHHVGSNKHYGKKFQLLKWQLDLIRVVFGYVYKDSQKRVIRKVFVYIPKKNGKSEFASAILLYLAYGDEEANAECYTAAADREQASIIYGNICKMILLDKTLTKVTKLIESKKELYYMKPYGERKLKHAEVKVFSSETVGKQGYNIHGLVIDELHEVNVELYKTLTIGTATAREQPLFFFLTTAGRDENGIWYAEYEYAKKWLSGKVNNLNYFALLFEVGKNEDYKNPDNWRKANPSINETFTEKDFEMELQEMEEKEYLLPDFKRLRLNMIDFAKQRVWELEKYYSKCVVDKIEVEREDCFLGLDLSSIHDTTSVVPVFKKGNEYYSKDIKIYIPEHTIKKRVQHENMNYHNWKEKGLIRATQGEMIDYDYILADIIELNSKYNIKAVFYDPYNAMHLVKQLENNNIQCFAFRQGWYTMSPACKMYLQVLSEGKLKIEHNEIVKWQLGNVDFEISGEGNYKPIKEQGDKSRSKNSNRRIDAIVGMIMAVAGASQYKEEKKVSPRMRTL